MKPVSVVEQIERLEDQLQAIKWAVRIARTAGRTKRGMRSSIVSQTAGLLRGRLPQGPVYQRRLRAEWERRFNGKTS
jgi:hypothetical protein